MRNNNDTLNNNDLATQIDPNIFNNKNFHFTSLYLIAGQSDRPTDVLESSTRTESIDIARLYSLYHPVFAWGDAECARQFLFTSPKQTLSISNVLISGVETINDAIRIFYIPAVELKRLSYGNHEHDS